MDDTKTDFEKFFVACIEALYFTDTSVLPDETEIPADAKLADETEAYLRADCLSFWRRFECYVEAADETAGNAGHDFWLTRNGHGAGFWDGDWPKPYAKILTDGAVAYGEFEVYLGDDGLIYV